jgi:hypothetical protein
MFTALEAASGGMTKKQRRRYQGIGGFDASQIESARLLVQRVLHTRMLGAPYRRHDRSEVGETLSWYDKSPLAYFVAGILQISSSNVVDASDSKLSQRGDLTFASYTPLEIRCLYALQLELDTFLPINVCAQCRVWAEQLYRAKCLRMNAPAMAIQSNRLPDGDDEDPSIPNAVANARLPAHASAGVKAVRKSILVAVLDVNNLKPAFGTSVVEAMCTLELSRPGGNHINSCTEV